MITFKEIYRSRYSKLIYMFELTIAMYKGEIKLDYPEQVDMIYKGVCFFGLRVPIHIRKVFHIQFLHCEKLAPATHMYLQSMYAEYLEEHLPERVYDEQGNKSKQELSFCWHPDDNDVRIKWLEEQIENLKILDRDN